MSVGASIYGYRNNFSGKKTNSRKVKKAKIKFLNLIIDGYASSSQYDDDYFVSICQWLLKKGYPRFPTMGYVPLFYGKIKHPNPNQFFMESLFSISPYFLQDLWINENKFDVIEWRKQFNLFEETEITGLNFYKCRIEMPLADFTSLTDIYKVIFEKKENEKLNFQKNEYHPDAIWVISKYIEIRKDFFRYAMTYGYKGEDNCWSIEVESDKNENYIDFCLKIFNNYQGILNGTFS